MDEDYPLGTDTGWHDDPERLHGARAAECQAAQLRSILMMKLTQLETESLFIAACSIADYPDAMEATLDKKSQAALKRAIRKLENQLHQPSRAANPGERTSQ